MARRRDSMQLIRMTVFRPSRRPRAGFVARWTDPATDRRRQKTLAAKTQRDAYAEAGRLADVIAADVDPDGMSWLEFCSRYERQALSRRSASSLSTWRTTKWYVEELAPLSSVAAATSAWVSRWQDALRGRMSPNTLATYSARLRAALRWAERQRIIDRAPWVAVEWEEVPASRAITGEEFDRILAAVPKIRPHDAPAWDRLLRALVRTNLRIGELARLSWDPDGEIRIEWHAGYPLIRKPPRSHKARKDRLEPILPAFWDVCCETPETDRAGLVFPLPSLRYGVHCELKTIVRTISKIGRKAGVVTNPDLARPKTATSHDIGRRGFLAQIDGLLTQSEAHKAMGHATFQTTAIYYDTRAMASIAAKLWGDRKP